MRWPARAALLLVLAGPAGLAAQRPAVSPPLARAWARDTTFAVWLFVRPRVTLADADSRLTAAGVQVRSQSRWLHALSADVPGPLLRTIADRADLARIQPRGRWRTVPAPRFPGLDPVQAAPAAGDTCAAAGDPTYGPSQMPYRALDLLPLANAGVNGAGVRVAIFDAGFNTLDPKFAGVTVTAQHDFVFGDSVVRNDSSDNLAFDPQFHGTAVWSLFAADVPGRLVGIARGASYLLAKTEDVRSETRVEEDNYVAALEWADSIGVDIVSSSLGYLGFDNGFSYQPSQLNGDVAVTTVAAESAAARGILVVTAAGNGGPGFRTLVTPGDGKSVVTVGAEDSLGSIAAFSSRGPSADGRIKPDVTAPGLSVCVDVDGGLARLSGTSFATPITAAASALIKQLNPGLGPLAIRNALRTSGANAAHPDSIRGWGRPDVSTAATFSAGITPVSPLPPALTSVTPLFSWNAGTIPGFAAPVTYRLRAARDSAFGLPIVDTTLTDITQYALTRPIKPGAPLFWRVDARASTGVTATTGVVGPIVVPAWARLTALSDSAGANITNVQPTFTWSSPGIAVPPGPFKYDIQIFRPSIPFPVYGAGGLSDSSFQVPIPLERNTTYDWVLTIHAGSDSTLVRSAGTFLILDPSLPMITLVYQNFPNPFPAVGRDSTCIWFDIASTAVAELEVLDLRGGIVRRFIPGPDFPEILPAGRYGRGAAGGPSCDPRLMWDGRADDGRVVPAGVYILKLKSGGAVLLKKIVFLGKRP